MTFVARIADSRVAVRKACGKRHVGTWPPTTVEQVLGRHPSSFLHVYTVVCT